jgi:hypothetical protein
MVLSLFFVIMRSDVLITYSVLIRSTSIYLELRHLLFVFAAGITLEPTYKDTFWSDLIRIVQAFVETKIRLKDC